MKKSFIAIALSLLTSNLCAEIVTETWDSELTAVDSEGHITEGNTHGFNMGERNNQVSCKQSELTVDGKVVASHEENCDISPEDRKVLSIRMTTH